MAAIKKLPSPITILMVVIIIAAIATWLVPAGKYSTLSANGDVSFTVASSDTAITVPFTQKTLDSLQIKISLAKFETGAIRKPVSIPGTYRSLKNNGQGF
jgi:uncharacterized ion transporter superfamily protein YfcC